MFDFNKWIDLFLVYAIKRQVIVYVCIVVQSFVFQMNEINKLCRKQFLVFNLMEDWEMRFFDANGNAWRNLNSKLLTMLWQLWHLNFIYILLGEVFRTKKLTEWGKAWFFALSAQAYLGLAHPSDKQKYSVGLNFGHLAPF